MCKISDAQHLDAVQLAGCAGSGRYTGQRRLMTGKMHDVFIVISEGGGGAHVARTVYADAKTTHAKHTTKTTPTSPSWRFTNETVPARHIRGGDVTPSRSGVWAGRRLDGHMARFAFEALGN